MAFEIIRDDKFIVTEMTEAAARVISMWKYDAPYESYSFNGDEQELSEVLNGLHFPVYFTSQKNSEVFLEDNAIISNPQGFIAWGPAAKVPCRFFNLRYRGKKYIDMALGLSPENCGKGFGDDFVKTAISFVQNDWESYIIRLTVESNNKRAIKVYERNGFVKKRSFKSEGKVFFIMVLEEK